VTQQQTIEQLKQQSWYKGMWTKAK
jgi:hypothetical protein